MCGWNGLEEWKLEINRDLSRGTKVEGQQMDHTAVGWSQSMAGTAMATHTVLIGWDCQVVAADTEESGI
jgi:hypothetical protein